jgi:hypothetical protein
MPPWENTQNHVYEFYCLFPTLVRKLDGKKTLTIFFIAVSLEPRIIPGTVHFVNKYLLEELHK